MRIKTNEPKQNTQPERPQPPSDWSTLLQWIEWRTDEPAKWNRLAAHQRERALAFNRQRAAGYFGTAWQSAAERARTQHQQPASIAA